MAAEKSMGLLLGLKPKGKGEEMSESSDPMGMGDEPEADSDPEMAAAQDLIDAVGSGSASAVKAALRASYDACAAKGMSDSDEEY